MSEIRINSLSLENYRSFGEQQDFEFPPSEYQKPIAIVGYNNSGKTNLMNAILYALQVNFVSKDTFTIDDFHNRKIENEPDILLNASSSVETKFDGIKQASFNGYHRLKIFVDGDEIEGGKIESLNSLEQNQHGYDDINWNAFGATRYFNIFYINFHNIKDEIVTQKSSWGNIKSFLGKHIKKIIDGDDQMRTKKVDFEKELTESTQKVLENSDLIDFIKLIQKNYTTNLRDNDCKVEFGLPKYEDIFLQMLFKVGLNGDKDNLIPINHFGDGYISMFVMAVIKAIAESSEGDKCLFLFEEPESFLHENHQEYFYKTVLCGLAERGHQVIYTTHSAKMIDIFDTKGLIRLEVDEKNQTVKKYNDISEFDPKDDDGASLARYNEYIKTIEPNLNRILFSKKVILVEGPNDVLVYKQAIKKKVRAIIGTDTTTTEEEKDRFAETYLNFHNISIVPHHGKGTAVYLAKVCARYQLNYYLINDWDFEIDFRDKVDWEIEPLQKDPVWDDIKKEKSKKGTTYAEKTLKGMITTLRNLNTAAKDDQIHFNVKKLETIIGYDSDDKDSTGIWGIINDESFEIKEELFPESLEQFLELSSIKIMEEETKTQETKEEESE